MIKQLSPVALMYSLNAGLIIMGILPSVVRLFPELIVQAILLAIALSILAYYILSKSYRNYALCYLSLAWVVGLINTLSGL